MAELKSAVTLQDVAKCAGVSKMTVSNVVNGKSGMSAATRQRVLEAIEQTGFVANSVARVLAGHSMNLLGVILPSFGSPYMTEIVHGATKAAEAAGFDLAIYTTSNNPQRERERATLLRSIADGVLLLMPVANEHQIFMNSVPVVSVNADGPYTVQANNHMGGQLAAEHLIALGHTRIALLGFYNKAVSSPDGKTYVPRQDVYERRQSFLKTLHKSNMDIPPEYLVETLTFEEVTMHAEKVAHQLLSLAKPPTAIFAMSDELAVGVFRAANSLGLQIPEDVSVIGFDDLPHAANLRPALTTIRQPVFEIGKEAANMLGQLARGQTPKEAQPVFPTQLVVRQSTAAPAMRTKFHCNSETTNIRPMVRSKNILGGATLPESSD